MSVNKVVYDAVTYFSQFKKSEGVKQNQKYS